MAQQLTKTLLQNGSVVGLKLTESIVSVVNNIDEELQLKADKDDVSKVQAEVALKPSIKDVQNLMQTVTDRYDGIVDEVKKAVGDKAEQTEVTDLSKLVEGYDSKITKCEEAVVEFRREVDAKATMDDIEQIKTAIETGLKSKTDSAEYTKFVGSMNNAIQGFGNDMDIFAKNVLGLLKCNDYILSEPPTAEEIAQINKMEPGSFYTINGGTVMMIFRDPYVDPVAK
jgi:hypothetical protein